jgi:hypothetical protein
LEFLFVGEEHPLFSSLLPWLEDFVRRRLVCVQRIFFFFFSCGVRLVEDFGFCELGKLGQGKMNDSDVSKQVQQMVHFIKQEAEEKANEISVAAEEEFNIEKLQLVEAEKKKIKQEYERKEKQVDVRKKM